MRTYQLWDATKKTGEPVVVAIDVETIDGPIMDYFPGGITDLSQMGEITVDGDADYLSDYFEA